MKFVFILLVAGAVAVHGNPVAMQGDEAMYEKFSDEISKLTEQVENMKSKVEAEKSDSAEEVTKVDAMKGAVPLEDSLDAAIADDKEDFNFGDLDQEISDMGDDVVPDEKKDDKETTNYSEMADSDDADGDIDDDMKDLMEDSAVAEQNDPKPWCPSWAFWCKKKPKKVKAKKVKKVKPTRGPRKSKGPRPTGMPKRTRMPGKTRKPRKPRSKRRRKGRKGDETEERLAEFRDAMIDLKKEVKQVHKDFNDVKNLYSDPALVDEEVKERFATVKMDVAGLKKGMGELFKQFNEVNNDGQEQQDESQIELPNEDTYSMVSVMKEQLDEAEIALKDLKDHAEERDVDKDDEKDAANPMEKDAANPMDPMLFQDSDFPEDEAKDPELVESNDEAEVKDEAESEDKDLMVKVQMMKDEVKDIIGKMKDIKAQMEEQKLKSV